MANLARNGVPHVFVTAEPLTPLPPGPLSCVMGLHGGGGNYHLFLPGASLHENRGLQMTDGIVVALDDSIYYQNGSDLLVRITMWLGYVESFDPFTSAPRDDPPDGSLIVNYTQRRVFWILDWLEHGINSPYSIDPERIAIIGHSGGGRGASHISRSQPERFCGVVLHNPGINLSAGSSASDPLAGSVTQNLATTLSDPNGNPVGLADVYDPTVRLTATQRDLAFTRAYFGKRDTSQSATWDANMRAVLDSMDAARLGYAISWDEREHPVGEWHTENPAIPGPDIAQWIAPVQSERPTGQYLVDHYRASQSYPGFFNVDLDALTPGRQPDPGNGDDPNDGDQFGTWGGYLEWDPNTLVDQPDRWECTIFATGLSALSIDNCPVPQLVADMAPRKTQSFFPPAGRRMRWRSTDVASGVLLQSGVSIADAEGVTFVTGLVVLRDPDRVHVVIEPCPQSMADVAACMLGPDAAASTDCACLDYDGDGDVDLTDIAALQVDISGG